MERCFWALNSDSSRFRLFFQPVLIAWALWSSGAWQSWRNTKKVNSKRSIIKNSTDMKLLQIIKYDELIDSLSINETEKPSIKATDILIETKAAGLSPSDYKMV
jgi:hypothetical protein